MKKQFAKIVSLVVCLLMILSLASACGQKDENATTSTTSTVQGSKEASDAVGNTQTSEASLKLPLVKDGSVTLSIGVFDNLYAPVSYANNPPVWAEIEKKTGVKIKWDVLPLSQYFTSMQTRVAAGGEDLPDLLYNSDVVKMGTSGLFIPLEDLIQEYAPNTSKYLNEHKDIKALFYAPDDHIYSYTTVVAGGMYINPIVWMIRKDWLDNVGLKVPQTMEELYTALKAFKEQDPNKNGKKDEIPYIQNSLTYLDFTTVFWGIHGPPYYYPDQDGKVKYQFALPQYKEALTWLNKIYSEGLLDPEFATTDGPKFISKITQNIAGFSCTFISGMTNYNNQLKTIVGPDAKYVPIASLQNGSNEQFINGFGPINGNMGITSACKNKEIAIQWLDYIFASPEGIELSNFGIEGKSFKRENGERKFTNWVLHNEDGLGAWDALRSLGAWPTMPFIQTEEAYKALFADDPEIMDAIKMASPYVKPTFPAVLATKEETDEIGRISTDFETYRNEMALKFIYGKESLDKYDEYVAKLKAIGLDKLEAIYQKQWDRYQAALNK